MILSTLVTSQLHFEMCAGLYGHPVYSLILYQQLLNKWKNLRDLWKRVSRPLPFISLIPNGSFQYLSWKQTTDGAYNIVKSYDNVIENFKLTWKVTKVASDNATSMAKSFKPFATLVLYCVITYLFISYFYM